MNLKKLSGMCVCAVLIGIGNQAMAWWDFSVSSNGAGGFSVQNSAGQSIGSFMPSGNGGWIGNFRGWTSTPNIFGGFNYSNSNGQSITSTPNIFGGFNFNSSSGLTGTSMRNIFGGYDYSGSLFRGQAQDSKSFFSNEIFKGKIDETAINTAIQTRNINAILSSAWDLKGYETISGQKDEKLNSTKLFKLAAHIAVEQNNPEALKAVIALAPECKKFEEQLAFKAHTRGAQKSIKCKTAFPELVYLPVNNWEKTLKTDLKDWQQPVADIYLCGIFRGMEPVVATTVSSLINNGRASMKPVMIARGAVALANFDIKNEFSPWFDPISLLSEAVELAISLCDKTGLEEIKTIYEKSILKNPEFTAYLTDQLAMFGNTRGADAPKAQPGDFSLSDIRSILNIED